MKNQFLTKSISLFVLAMLGLLSSCSSTCNSGCGYWGTSEKSLEKEVINTHFIKQSQDHQEYCI